MFKLRRRVGWLRGDHTELSVQKGFTVFVWREGGGRLINKSAVAAGLHNTMHNKDKMTSCDKEKPRAGTADHPNVNMVYVQCMGVEENPDISQGRPVRAICFRC